jgi:acetyl-CoA carboxylase biotin carboxyl carrier protein
MKINKIEKLVKILESSIVSEIEVTDIWGRKVRVSKSTNNTVPGQSPTQAPIAQIRTENVAQPAAEKTMDTMSKNAVAIRSPIVGTFYRASSPEIRPYVEIGDIVKSGQVVCIVEAMKLMNEIESDVAGKITKILVKNEAPIEYNQELFLVEAM